MSGLLAAGAAHAPRSARAAEPAEASSGAARAPPAPAPAASSSPGLPAPADPLTRAKELFRQGNELRKVGDLDRALGLFLQSRALLPSVPNTLNAAICLDQLGRSDEAVELYEQLLIEFAGKLEDADRNAVGAALAALRRKVGSVTLSANVQGSVVVDGRARGVLPLAAPLRVLPGRHLVRVLREGYVTGEGEVTVGEGESRALDLRLEPLAASGRLAVTCAGEPGSSGPLRVLVDGAPLGPAPWQGLLSPGRHLVWLQGSDAGTAPVAVNVVAGQTVPLSLSPRPLGPPLRVEPDPRSATLAIDGVELGAGAFEGRLPLGPHAARASEEGYLSASVALEGSRRGVVVLRLAVDPDHPRWRSAERARLGVEVFGGYALGSSFRGAAEGGCPEGCSSHAGPGGVLVGARAAYVLPSRLGAELGVGFLRVAASLHRSEASSSPAAVYALDDALRVAGPFVTGGLAYRLPLSPSFGLLGRASVGVLFASARDAVSGSAAHGGSTVPVSIENAGQSAHGVDVFVAPELGAELTRGAFHVGLGLIASVFLLDGPALPTGEIDVQSDASAGCRAPAGQTNPPVACVRGSRVIAGEPAFGRFVLWTPTLTAGAVF